MSVIVHPFAHRVNCIFEFAFNPVPHAFAGWLAVCRLFQCTMFTLARLLSSRMCARTASVRKSRAHCAITLHLIELNESYTFGTQTRTHTLTLNALSVVQLRNLVSGWHRMRLTSASVTFSHGSAGIWKMCSARTTFDHFTRIGIALGVLRSPRMMATLVCGGGVVTRNRTARQLKFQFLSKEKIRHTHTNPSLWYESDASKTVSLALGCLPNILCVACTHVWHENRAPSSIFVTHAR